MSFERYKYKVQIRFPLLPSAYTCSQPRMNGLNSTNNQVTRYYFDAVSGSCASFTFSITTSPAYYNGNNFATRDHCESYCSTGTNNIRFYTIQNVLKTMLAFHRSFELNGYNSVNISKLHPFLGCRRGRQEYVNNNAPGCSATTSCSDPNNFNCERIASRYQCCPKISAFSR